MTETIENGRSKLTDLPAAITQWRVEEGRDWSNDPAVWVWAKLGNDDTAYPEIGIITDRVIDTVREIEHQPGLFVYVYFRGSKEPLYD